MMFPHPLLDFVRAHREELTLSVYIEAAPTDPAARRNWRVRLRQGLHDVRDALVNASADERDVFERCAANVLARLPSGDAPAADLGWACFAAASGDVLDLHLRDAAETSVSWGPGAQVVPYLRVATEARALVVWVDHLHLRVARWMDGTLHPLAALEVEASRDGDTDALQRHRDEASERLLVDARHHIARFAEAHTPILIGGAAETSARLLDLLPDHLATQATLVPGLVMHLSDGASLPVIHATLHEMDATLRSRRVTELREMAHARGRATLGLAPARAAADIGALAELIFSERAWRQQPQAIEDLVQRALVEGADVAVASAATAFPLDGEGDGVIAGLRFPLPARR